jgi:hypothetical protein
MRILFFLLITCLLATGCDPHECGCTPPPRPLNDHFKATVVQTHNLDCGKSVISFDPSDTAAVYQITGRQTSNFFVVKELSSSLNISGQKLWVTIDNLRPEEEFICLTMGPAYHHIKLLDAEIRE